MRAYDVGFRFGLSYGVCSAARAGELLAAAGLAASRSALKSFRIGMRQAAGCGPRPNARFWVWYSAGDCWVKLTLRPEQTLRYVCGGSTDEGFSVTRESYTHEGDLVCAVTTTDARDCDGLHSYTGSAICRLEHLRARDMSQAYEGAERDNAGIFAPEWDNVRRSQRDQFAEAAGY